MSEPLAYGIDFGTSNSEIAVAYRDRVELLDDLTDPGVPSILYLDADGLNLVGEEAVQQHLLRFAAKQSRLMSSLKSIFADRTFESTSTWGRTWELEDLGGLILRYLKHQADERLGADVKRVVLGHPVVFHGAEGDEADRLQRLAMDRLRGAGRRAGFREVELLDEPTAALLHDDLPSGVNVALDFGGGTFDVSVIEYRERPRRAEVRATHGAAVGGDEFDGHMFDLALHKRLGLDHIRYADSIGACRTTTGMLGMVQDFNALDRLVGYIRGRPRSGLRILKRIIDNGQAFALSKAVEEAKIQLSRRTTASVTLVRHEAGININQEVSRRDFEERIADRLDLVFEVVDRTLADAGVGPTNVDQVVLTGGSCRLPAFRRRAKSKFGPRVSERSEASRVALGLASEARRIWS